MPEVFPTAPQAGVMRCLTEGFLKARLKFYLFGIPTKSEPFYVVRLMMDKQPFKKYVDISVDWQGKLHGVFLCRKKGLYSYPTWGVTSLMFLGLRTRKMRGTKQLKNLEKCRTTKETNAYKKKNFWNEFKSIMGQLATRVLVKLNSIWRTNYG